MTRSRYADYPTHPLRDVPQEVLDVVRENVCEAAVWRDVAEDMAEPIADSCVSALYEAGYRITGPHTECPAVIHHGPGHQSTTRCELTLPHDEHQSWTLGFLLEWEGDEAYD